MPSDSTSRAIGPMGHMRAAVVLGLLAALSVPTMAQAAPRLRCQLEQGGTTQVHEFAPVADPYGVAAIDINGRFRFKAVMIGDERQIQYIKLYTHYQTARRLIILHEVSYLRPRIPAGTATVELTGRNFLYSPGREREFQFSCSLIGGTP